MNSILTYLLYIFVVLSVILVYLERISPRHKNTFENHLIGIWIFLEDLNYHHVASVTAARAESMLANYFGKKIISWQGLLQTLKLTLPLFFGMFVLFSSMRAYYFIVDDKYAVNSYNLEVESSTALVRRYLSSENNDNNNDTLLIWYDKLINMDIDEYNSSLILSGTIRYFMMFVFSVIITSIIGYISLCISRYIFQRLSKAPDFAVGFLSIDLIFAIMLSSLSNFLFIVAFASILLTGNSVFIFEEWVTSLFNIDYDNIFGVRSNSFSQTIVSFYVSFEEAPIATNLWLWREYFHDMYLAIQLKFTEIDAFRTFINWSVTLPMIPTAINALFLMGIIFIKAVGPATRVYALRTIEKLISHDLGPVTLLTVITAMALMILNVLT